MPRQTRFQLALYSAEPEEHDLTLHEIKNSWYWRMKPAVRMQVVDESASLKFKIEFTAAWNRLDCEVAYVALLGDGKLLRSKKVGPMWLDPRGVYDFTYELLVEVS